MTYKELYLKEHPECEDFSKICDDDCPGDFYDSGSHPCNDTCPFPDNCGENECRDCWDQEIGTVSKDMDTAAEAAVKASENLAKLTSAILDSGTRREFSTGAVRDIQEGKGRCDLMPLDVIAEFMTSSTQKDILNSIHDFQETGEDVFLKSCLYSFIEDHIFVKDSLLGKTATTLLEVAKHFEAGAKKYGEYNWQKGIPTHCYIDSAVRHYLKFLRGDKDEPHDRAFVWNILCCIWTCKHKPGLNVYLTSSQGGS